jgi:hypothetical protein
MHQNIMMGKIRGEKHHMERKITGNRCEWGNSSTEIVHTCVIMHGRVGHGSKSNLSL